MMVDMDSLTITSLNCRGFNLSKSQYIRQLLLSCDILFLQEHWMSHDQAIRLLGDLNSEFLCISVSGFDDKEVLLGRPYGGFSIFWRKSIKAVFSRVDLDSNRILALRMEYAGTSIVFINVYLPYERDASLDDFLSCLNAIDSVVDQYNNAHFVIGGDFNVDFNRDTTHTKILKDFLLAKGLARSSECICYEVDFTYHFRDSRYHILDHFVVSDMLAYAGHSHNSGT